MSSVMDFFKFYFRKSFPLTFFSLLFFKRKVFILQKLPPEKQRSLPYLPTGTSRDYYFRIKETSQWLKKSFLD